MKLHYLGHEPGAVIPLPEGWPAYDHEETNEDAFRAKIDSGAYDVVDQVEAPTAKKGKVN